MKKLQDFATECGVTDRAIQKHLKKHEAELIGHFERKGPNGTWLDEYAQEYIRGLMIQQPIVLQDNVAEVQELRLRLTEKQDKIENLQDRIIDLQGQLQTAQLQTAQIALLEADIERRNKDLAQAQQAAQTASDELTAAHAELEATREQLSKALEEKSELEKRKWWQLLFK